MASHSRPSAPRTTDHRDTSRAVHRAALTLALASAASAPLLGAGGASAQPRQSPEEVRAEVADLYREAEEATQSYDGAEERADRAAAAVARLQDEMARKTAALNAGRDALGTVAAAQYRGGSLDPTLQLVLSSSPDVFLERAGMLRQSGARQSAALTEMSARSRDLAATREKAARTLASLRSAQSRLAAHKHTVETKLARARELLAGLAPAERVAMDGGLTEVPWTPGASGGRSAGRDAAASRAATRLALSFEATPSGAPSARAAAAVAFAYRAIGRPYVWGATGPQAYDCSGLTQAAWRSAGVALPRTTYTQINAGSRVPRSRLRPGDLVFFYSGVSHVGIYVGGGRMIHAPRPGAAVEVAPVSEMPFAGATRPA